jgi:glycosyltransferase involved in cell wall biosynthesis
VCPAGTVSVVVPCFDERARLARLGAGYRRLASMVDEVIVVDDGSTDDTSGLVEEMSDRYSLHNTSVLRLEHNLGKGAAVAAGVIASHGETVVFMDADLATDLDDLPRLVRALDHYDVVVGSRTMPGHIVIGGRWYRSVMGRTFNQVVRRTTGLRLSDTQCGFKGFRGQWARTLFADLGLQGFSFDVEVLMRARSLGLSIGEIPVRWTAVDGSHVRPVRDSWRMMRDMRSLAARIPATPTSGPAVTALPSAASPRPVAKTA